MFKFEEQSSTDLMKKTEAEIFLPFSFLFSPLFSLYRETCLIWGLITHCLVRNTGFKHPRTLALKLRFSPDEDLTLVLVLLSHPTKKSFLLLGTFKISVLLLEPPKTMIQSLQKLCPRVSNVLRLWDPLNTSHSVYNTDSDLVSQRRVCMYVYIWNQCPGNVDAGQSGYILRLWRLHHS